MVHVCCCVPVCKRLCFFRVKSDVTRYFPPHTHSQARRRATRRISCNCRRQNKRLPAPTATPHSCQCLPSCPRCCWMMLKPFLRLRCAEHCLTAFVYTYVCMYVCIYTYMYVYTLTLSLSLSLSHTGGTTNGIRNHFHLYAPQGPLHLATVTPPLLLVYERLRTTYTVARYCVSVSARYCSTVLCICICPLLSQ